MTSTTADAADVRAADAEPALDEPAHPGFLPLPEPLEPRARRRHRIILACLMLFGLAQGAYWAVTTVVWNPIDEVAHFGYVESLATGEGVPTVGIDLLSDEVLASFKQSPTMLFRSFPYQPTNTDANWGGTLHQYEAIHGPTYYAAMVPFYWVGRPFGTLGSLYAIRLATVALVLVAIPLTWMLARRLFPDRPVVWLLAPGLLVAVNSLSAGAVSNDAMVLVLSIVTTLLFLRALDQPRTWWTSGAAGILFGLTIVTKMTSLVLVPFLAIAFVGWVVTQRPKLLAVGRFVGLFVAGAAVAFAPWLYWNLRKYHATSAAVVVDGITGVSLPQSELTLYAINQHAWYARPGVWVSQLILAGSYQTTWEVAVVAALVLGGLAAVLGKRWRELAILLWCGSALPLAFISMEIIVFGLFGGTGGPVGRHLIAALAPTMVMIAAAAVMVVGSRWAPPLIAAFVAWTLVLQVGLARQFIDVAYLDVSIDHVYAPVVYQDWSDGVRDDRDAIAVSVACPVQVIGVGFMEKVPGAVPSSVPTSLVVRSASGETVASGGMSIYAIQTYRLPTAVTSPFTIELPPGSLVRTTGEDRADAVDYPGAEGDPVVTAYCAEPDADERAFEQMYTIGHPDRVSLGMLHTAPVLLAAVGVLTAVGLAINALRSRATGSRSPSSTQTPAEP